VKDILKNLRSRGVLFAPDAGIEKFDGYTETWLRATFPVTSLKQLRALVLDEEEWELGKSARKPRWYDEPVDTMANYGEDV
jgi:hypothetical protein